MTQQTSPSDVARIFDGHLRDDGDVAPRYNVAPTDPVLVVLERDEGRLVERYRWGLIPAWASDAREGSRKINARAETIASSPAFRVAFRRRRCIVPADGFYEWERRGGRRQPWYIRHADGSPLAMAGLWSVWKDPANGQWLPSCSIVTTEANAHVGALHDRMPVLLPEDAWALWLDPRETSVGVLLDLLVPSPADELELYPVSPRVNSVRNDGPDLIVPLADAASTDPNLARDVQQTLFG